MVTYANPCILARAVGHFGAVATPIDIWVCGWKFSLSSTFSVEVAELETMLAAMALPVENFHKAAGVQAGTNCYLDKLQAAILGTDGKYFGTSQETVEHPISTHPAGVGTPVHPYSTACRYTHFSNYPRGKASRGGVYWPTTAASINPTTGEFSDVSLRLTAYQTLVNALNAAVDPITEALSLSVMGQDTTQLAHGSPARTGVVVEVGVGKGPDTQRRRDNKVLEAHSKGAVTFSLSADTPHRTTISSSSGDPEAAVG